MIGILLGVDNNGVPETELEKKALTTRCTKVSTVSTVLGLVCFAFMLTEPQTTQRGDTPKLFNGDLFFFSVMYV